MPLTAYFYLALVSGEDNNFVLLRTSLQVILDKRISQMNCIVAQVRFYYLTIATALHLLIWLVFS